MTIKDCTSVKESWQLKKERGSKNYLILGFDAAKDDHTALFGTALLPPNPQFQPESHTHNIMRSNLA